MRFASNTREQKVIASPKGCAKMRKHLLLNDISPLWRRA
jgi:hypothetical protein